MKLRWLCLIVAVIGASATHRVFADAVIDGFQTPQNLAAGPGGGAFGPLMGTVGGAGILGGSRTMSLSGNAFTAQTVSMSVGAGFAQYESGSRSTGVGSLLYNGGGAGLGALLAMTQAISVSLVAFNHGSNPSTLSVTINDGSLSQTVSVALTASTLAPQLLTFDFTGLGLNFNNIASLLLTLDSNNAAGADIVLQELIARMTPVPEPASVALWSMLAVGSAWYLRRSRLNPAAEPLG